jgi:hypothetical protein
MNLNIKDMDNQNKNNQKQDKPVGYGSSIQSSGNGNLSRPQNQEDVNPTTEQDHIQHIKDAEDAESTEPLPKTTGTGANNPISNASSLIIKSDDQE